MSLFDEQNSNEQDFLNGPGFTGKDLHPDTFEGFGPLTQAKAVVGGVEEGVGVLAHGLPSLVHNVLESGAYMGAAEQGADADEAVQGVKEFEKPWAPKLAEVTDTIQQAAREQAKSLMPDPAVSGTGTNLIYGFTKGAAQAALTTAATRNPMAAAPLFGYMQGMGHYQDLRDQGVDDATAQKSATLQGILAAGSFAVPGGLPARWLDEMAPATQAITQLAAGATINTASGMVSRYGTAQILENAGYHELAEQNRVLDGQAMVADILSGAFFGGVHFFHGRAQELADQATRMAEDGTLDPSVRDGAKVAQDNRAASVDRAPGIPVDGETAGAHRAALEKAVSDVLSDRPVDVSDELDDSHVFAARPEDPETTLSTRELIHREFIDAGVMGEASDVDAMEHHLERIYRGESVPPFEGEVRIPTDVPRETNQADTTGVLAQGVDLQNMRDKPVYIPLKPEGPTKPTPGKIPSVEPNRMSLMEAAAVTKGASAEKHGISIDEARAQGLDPADLNAARFGNRRVFTKGGASFDEMAEALSQHGYPVHDEEGRYSANSLLDSLDKELRGNKQYSPAADDYLARLREHENMQQEAGQRTPHDEYDRELELDSRLLESRQEGYHDILAEEAMQRLIEENAAHEGPKMIDLAAKCAGMTR